MSIGAGREKHLYESIVVDRDTTLLTSRVIIHDWARFQFGDSLSLFLFRLAGSVNTFSPLSAFTNFFPDTLHWPWLLSGSTATERDGKKRWHTLGYPAHSSSCIRHPVAVSEAPRPMGVLKSARLPHSLGPTRLWIDCGFGSEIYSAGETFSR